MYTFYQLPLKLNRISSTTRFIETTMDIESHSPARIVRNHLTLLIVGIQTIKGPTDRSLILVRFNRKQLKGLIYY